ncbi:spermidine synthase [Kineococcus indalonis]|uniref:spermidine synthase n=1 Tax=Kineococcus indalonis TaxID=2696566 RepID=UPI001412BE1A|nr:fused MFS/spermidine synthase [Kineococcus indalonis]NAZ86792.1 spermidine synthase-like protein [Kineococcus indalonis]
MPRSPRPRPQPRRTAARRPDPVEGEALISTGTVRLERDRDDPDGWLVLVNGVPSSYVDLADPEHLVFEYQQWTAAVLDAVHPPGPLRVVHLGGAGCAFPRYVAATRPGSRQLVLEVDERLVELVRRSFGASASAGFRLKVAEARAGVAALPDASQDALVRDAFVHDAVPSHLVTVEFLRDVARVLAPGGVWVANLADRPPMPHARAELATAAEVFAHVAVLAEPGVFRGRRYGNALLVASQEELPERALVRALSGGAAPARLVAGEEARHFRAGAGVVTDAAVAALSRGAPAGSSPAGPGTTAQTTAQTTRTEEPDA